MTRTVCSACSCLRDEALPGHEHTVDVAGATEAFNAVKALAEDAIETLAYIARISPTQKHHAQDVAMAALIRMGRKPQK